MQKNMQLILAFHMSFDKMLEWIEIEEVPYGRSTVLAAGRYDDWK